MPRFILSILSLAALVLLATADVSSAQIVQIGPDGGVRVRAPFVRVDVAPGGGTSVRAPFTSVNVPGRFDPRYTGQPLLNGLSRPAISPRERARLELLSEAQQLDSSLSRFNTGQSWQRYLHVPELITAASSVNVDEKEMTVYQSVMDRFAAVKENPDFAQIARLQTFEGTRSSLGRYLELLSQPEQSPPAVQGTPRPGVPADPNVPEEILPRPLDLPAAGAPVKSPAKAAASTGPKLTAPGN